MQKTLFLLGLCLGAIACDSSSWEETTPVINRYERKWVKTFGGSEEDIAHDIIATADGGFALLGNSQSTDGNLLGKTRAGSDIVLMKFNAAGSLEWVQNYGGSEDERGHSLVQLPDNGYLLLGYAMSADGDLNNNEGQHDNWVLRVDDQGELLWQKSYGFAGHDHAYHIMATQDGGFLFNGFLDVTSSQGQGATDKQIPNPARHGVGEFWVHKLDANGELQWRKYFGGTNNDRSYAAVEVDGGNFVLVGTSESIDVDIRNPRGGYDIWAIKIDQNGTLLWEQSFGGSETDGANAVALTPDQKLLILGNTVSIDQDVSSPLGNSDFWLLTLDLDGNLVTERSYGGSDFDLGRDLLVNRDQNVWLTGYSRSNDIDLTTNRGDNDVALFYMDSNQFPKQQFTLGGSGQDLAHALVEYGQGGVLVTGSTESADGDFTQNRGDKDIFIAYWDLISQ